MNRPRRIKKLIRAACRTGSGGSEWTPADERILRDASAVMSQARTENQQITHICVWRKIMESKMTRYSAAAVVALAAALVLTNPFGGSRHGVALADVQTALEAQQTVFAKGTRVLTVDEMPVLMPPDLAPLFERPGGETGPFVLTLVAETYMSSQGYATKIYDKNGGFLAEVCVHNETGTATVLLHTAKAYLRFEVSQAYRDKMAGFTIRGFVDMMYRSGEYQTIGPKRVGNVDATGFEVADWHERILEGFDSAIVRFFFNMQHVTARVWIDPHTKLPIQTEADVRMKACLFTFFKDARAEQIDNEFQWGVEIDEATFLPEIPQGYQKLSPPGGAAIGVAASSAVLAGVAPWCLLCIRRSRRRAQASRVC
jgi:hypothetical protein